MDSVSSASKALMEYMSTPSTSSSKSVAESKLALLEISGIALTVPYLIKMGVSASEATTLRPAATTLITSLFRDAEATFSPFLPTSELEAKINKVRHTDRIHVSPNMMEVLAVCNDLVDWSDDHFDPTCVPVGRWAVAATKSVLQQTNSLSTESRNNIEHSSWFPSVSTEESGDVTNAIQSVVSGADFAEKRRHVGWRANIVLGADWVQKRSPHTEMDISAVSKGWVVDQLLLRLVQEFGLLDVYVDWGGDIRCVGTRPPADDDAPTATSSSGGRRMAQWTAGVLSPPLNTTGHADRTSSSEPCSNTLLHQCNDFVELPSAGASLCTSGDYYQWCHLIDAVTPAPSVDGRPVDASMHSIRSSSSPPASVSLMLVGLPCALCDGLSTSLFLMLRRMRHEDVLSKLSSGLPCPKAVGAVVGSLLVSLRSADGTLERLDWTSAVRTASSSSSSSTTVTPQPLQRRLSMSTLAGVPKSQERSALLDTTSLRRLFRTVPRTVAVLLLPMENGAYYACAVSSLLQTSPMCVTVFLEKQTAAAALVEKTLNDKGRGGGNMKFSVGFVAPETLRRTVQGGTGLLEAVASGVILPAKNDPLLLDAFHIAAYKATIPLPSVGDHVALCGEWTQDASAWSYSRHGAQSTTTNGLHPGDYLKENDATSIHLMLRLDRKYMTIAPPAPPAKWKWFPRARCVATVCIGNVNTGRVENCLGTVLTSLDITSRNPLLLTVYAPAGPLNDLLFWRTPSVATIPIVRLHVYEHEATGDELVDWFKDVTCVDPGMQFMYHPSPNRTMKNKGSSDDAVWVHEYELPSSRGAAKLIGVVDTSVEAVLRPVDNVGYIVVLRPVMCNVEVGDTATNVCCSYGFL